MDSNMFIAHLPAGYIVSNVIAKRIDSNQFNIKLFVIAGMIGAIAPDLDMIYFYLFDHKQHHHHSYFTHYSILWFSLLLFSIVLYQVVIDKSKAILAIIFSINACLHMILDSFVGDIWWFAPFIDKPYVMFTVTARYQPWWLNFIFHWSFFLELLISAWAFIVFRGNRQTGAIENV